MESVFLLLCIVHAALSTVCIPPTAVLTDLRPCVCDLFDDVAKCIPRDFMLTVIHFDEEAENYFCFPAKIDPLVIRHICDCSINYDFVANCADIRIMPLIQGRKRKFQGRNYNIQGRIVGGELVRDNTFPFALLVEYKDRIHCGAAIISEQWAVTAGHCFDRNKLHELDKMQVKAGTLDRTASGETFRMTKVVRHEGYQENSFSFNDDIAVFKVDRPFNLQNNMLLSPNMPQPHDQLPAGTMVTVVGWGLEAEAGKFSEILREVQLPLLSNDECREVLGNIITHRMLCAGYRQGGKDACQGDSGGPMMWNNILIGIVSFGEGCARENFPGVYTKVSEYLDWIRNNTESPAVK